jgi:putative sigma-54 modulation protein
MNMKINSVRFDADQKLIEFIESKLDKLNQFDDQIIGAEVFLRLENNQGDENKLTEIRLNVSKDELFAKKQCKTFEEATDQSIEALRRQLIKKKGKKNGR